MKPRVSVGLLLGLCVTASAAHAQIARVGNTFTTANSQTLGLAVGYDSVNDVYLTLGGDGTPKARFVSADGAVLGQEIPISSTSAQFPNVAYSPDTGAFLVTWHSAGRAWAQLVKYPGGLASAATPISPGDFVYPWAGAPVAYSTVTKEFLVVFRNYATFDILGIRVGNDGLPIGGAFSVSASASQPAGLYMNSPSIAYNPSTDEFFVAYRAGVPASAKVRRVKPGTGQLLGEPILLTQTLDIFLTAIAYMPATGQMLAAWYQSHPDAALGRVINSNGSLAGNVTPLSSRYGTYDSLSIRANGVSGTILLAGHDKLDVEDGGVEIDTTGVPIGTGMQLTAAGGRGNFFPEVAGHNSRREWLVTASNGFVRMIAQRVSTATVGGGPGSPSCTYAISSTFLGVTASPTSSSVTVAATTGCEWTAVSNSSWLTVTSASGRGNGSATFGIGRNVLPVPRIGTLTIAGQTFTVGQAAAARPTAATDVDGDGRTDLAVYRPSGGEWFVRQSHSNYGFGNWLVFQWGLPGDRPLAGDFDGDGVMDLVVFRPSSGQWFIRFSSTGYGYTSAPYQWGLSTDTPLVADFDGDGRADLVVYRPSTGEWFVRTSSSGYSYAYLWYQWGLQGDRPIPADFDGDGRTDLAVYRPATSEWFIRFSSSNYSFANAATYLWGTPGDLPLVTDFDGDHKTDLVVYRPGNGTWYVRFSSSGYSFVNWTAFQWGLPGDTPVVGDFDGDGRTDLTVFRPATGEWFVRYSSTEYGYNHVASYQWGIAGDVPLTPH